MSPDDQHQTPARSNQQRMDALAKANRIRSERKRIKAQIASGELRVADILANPPEDLATFKLFELLKAMPKFGPIKARHVMMQFRISQNKTVGGLSPRQRQELTKHFGGVSDLSHLPTLAS